MDTHVLYEPHFAWLALGLALAALELAFPGVFLIWLGGAAIVTGLLAWFVPVSVPLQVLIFAVLAVAALYAGKQWLKAHPLVAADPKMNDRGARAVGESVVVTQVIAGGSGRVKLGDSEWIAKGPDAEPGTRMRVSGHDGAVLLVEHLH
jgi:inner membrane protein